MPNIKVTDDLGSWMGLRPEMAPGLIGLSEAVYSKSLLPRRVQEIARMRIALANECAVCLGARYAQPAADGLDEAFYAQVLNWRDAPGYSARERLAAEYAERFALDHVGLRADADFWQRFRQHYSEAEIVDLAICCSLWLGAGRTMRVLDVGQSCSLTLGS
ncbi:MAG: carboxymuconolactone decarboxylase family protein [Stagnimonas sp.]|nr:carboxymuconolactone decarboxylase family protein [Stagnimonas sp.]